VHSTTNNGDYFQYSFLGTGISFISEFNSDEGNAAITLDGVFQTSVNCSNATRLPQQTVYAISNLPPQTHTLQITKDGGERMLVDAVIVQGASEVLINDADLAFTHVPSDWSYSSGRGLGEYHNDVHYTANNGEYVKYTFSGAGISVITELNPDEGRVNVALDGVSQTTVNCSNSTRIVQQRIYTASNLAPGTHTLTLTKISGSYMLLDALAIVPSNDSFTLSASPVSLAVGAGASGTCSVGLKAFNGYSNTVTLALSGLPAGASASFSPATLSGSGFSVLTVTTSNNTPLSVYNLAVDGVIGNITNSTAVGLDIISGAPIITTNTQPARALVYPGSPVTFSVSASGAPPLCYQWYFNTNTPIPDATGASYTLSQVQLANVGGYHCVITNSQGAATSSVSPLTVVDSSERLYETTVLSDNPLALWRLAETNGLTAYDTVGGNDGTYHNAELGLASFNYLLNPDLAAGFGLFTNQNSYVSVNNLKAIDFSGNSSAEFSVEAWFKGAPQSAVGATIIARGSGGGGEQFALDCYYGANFRFFVRDNSANYYGVNSSFGPDGNWHHVVGECSSTTGALSLYVDGTLSASGSFPVGGLLLSNSVPVSIGSKQQNPPNYDAQTSGSLGEVAVYKYALNPAQIMAHYQSGTNSIAFLSIHSANGSLILDWPAGGVLQSASQAAGPYSDVSNAVPSSSVTPANQQEFYRLRVGP
jgi:hypothetical protein